MDYQRATWMYGTVLGLLFTGVIAVIDARQASAQVLFSDSFNRAAGAQCGDPLRPARVGQFG